VKSLVSLLAYVIVTDLTVCAGGADDSGNSSVVSGGLAGGVGSTRLLPSISVFSPSPKFTISPVFDAAGPGFVASGCGVVNNSTATATTSTLMIRTPMSILPFEFSASSEYLPRPIRLAPQYGHRLRTPEYFLSHLAHLTSDIILIQKPPFCIFINY
jgi:hypothetical protein